LQRVATTSMLRLLCRRRMTPTSRWAKIRPMGMLPPRQPRCWSQAHLRGRYHKRMVSIRFSHSRCRTGSTSLRRRRRQTRAQIVGRLRKARTRSRNRLIPSDSARLFERDFLRSHVHCINLDLPWQTMVGPCNNTHAALHISATASSMFWDIRNRLVRIPSRCNVPHVVNDIP